MLPLLVFDLVFAALAVLFYGGALLPAVLLLLWAHHDLGWLGVPFVLPVAYVAFLVGLVLLLGLTRLLLLPRLQPGRFRLPRSWGFAKWLMHLTLQRYVNNALVKDSLFYVNSLRSLYLWLMGARVHPSVSVSGYVNLMDLSLLEVGRGTIIGSGVAIFGHFMAGRVLVLRRNRIGAEVVIGAQTLIGPGTTIGDGAFIGAACGIGTNVTIGARCRIEPGSVVLPGTKIPDGETWGGWPARRVEKGANAVGEGEPDASASE